MTGLLLYLAALTLPAPALALLAVRFRVLPILRKTYLIDKELAARAPQCVRISSFLASVMNAGGEFQFHAHAILVEHGRNYYWSYSEMSFFEGNAQLDRNFACPTR